VVRAWNSTLGGLKVPDLVPVIGGLSLPKLEEFNKGGIVPGIQGAPMLAVVHGGEQILRPSEVAGSAGSEMSDKRVGDVFVTVNQSDASPYEIGREILWQMKVAG
jgi:hypothetical protein